MNVLRAGLFQSTWKSYMSMPSWAPPCPLSASRDSRKWFGSPATGGFTPSQSLGNIRARPVSGVPPKYWNVAGLPLTIAARSNA